MKEHPMAFIWWDYDKPFLHNKTTKMRIMLKVEKNVPVLDSRNVEVLENMPITLEELGIANPARISAKSRDPEFIGPRT